jgi:enoyl-CoA hydratase
VNTLTYERGAVQPGPPCLESLGVFFDGIARHTPEGHAFAARAAEAGFKQAVRERDAPYKQ